MGRQAEQRHDRTRRSFVRSRSHPSTCSASSTASEGATANRNAIGRCLSGTSLAGSRTAGGLDAMTNLANSSGPRRGRSIASSTQLEYTQTFGDWGVPGSGGLRFCGNSSNTAPRRRRSTASVQRRCGYADLDRNHNGMIEKNEWRGELRARFAIHDWDGDGVLSGDEVATGCSSAVQLPRGAGLQHVRWRSLLVSGREQQRLPSTATSGMEASTRSISSTATTTAGSPRAELNNGRRIELRGARCQWRRTHRSRRVAVVAPQLRRHGHQP